MPNNDWRFKDFKDTKGAYNRTLAVPTSDFARANFQSQYGSGPTAAKLGPAYSGMDRGYNSGTGALAPKPLTAPVTATSRIIPSPSGTNWNSTFVNNMPTSPSGTNWQKTFGSSQPNVGGTFASRSSASPSSALNPPSSFQFGLSPAGDRSSLSLTSDLRLPTSDFADRLADVDLTSRDHELYGAGTDYGFND